MQGSGAYMAPEQFEEKKAALTPKTDIWAFACIFIHMVTGEAPTAGMTREQHISRVSVVCH